MALTKDDLRAQLNGASSDDSDAFLQRLLDAATRHVERQLGYEIDDQRFADGTPADLEQAVLMLAAHYYENREASLVGVAAQPVPMGVAEIIAEHREYTYG